MVIFQIHIVGVASLEEEVTRQLDEMRRPVLSGRAIRFPVNALD
jgi:hypothetical protein